MPTVVDTPPAEVRRPLDAGALADIAAGLAQGAGAGEHDWVADGGRRYTRLLATDGYEAWLIVWEPGATLDLHDHGESVAAVAVVAGELTETFADLRGTPRLWERRVGAGASFSVPAGRVHGIANDGAVAARSVHVYSPPLGAMTFYDATGDRAVVARPAAG